MNEVKKTQIITNQRSRATADALASVRAEGLVPSASTTKRLEQYAAGRISASQLHRETLNEVKTRHKSMTTR